MDPGGLEMLTALIVAHRTRIFAGLTLAGLLLAAFLPARFTAPVTAQQGNVITPNIPVVPPGQAYKQTNLVSDLGGLAFVLDPSLVNPWGISVSLTSPFWVANNGTSTATLYGGDVAGIPLTKNALTVSIPGLLPTGTVFNGSSDFVITSGGGTGPARFIFASLNGNITAWRAGTVASTLATQSGRVYTGLAIGAATGGNRLYAADFKNGNIDVYDPFFALTTVSGGFLDATIPTTAGNTYHPFNIQNIGTSLYVTYAKVGVDGDDDAGVGHGYVRRFSFDGVRDPAFGIDTGELNSPWGVAIAPASFGIYGAALLVGNFGEGNPSIHAYASANGAFLGTLQNEAATGIVIDELWALQFGNGGNGGDPNTLYFTAGIGEEEHGLFGSLKPTTASATSLVQFATDDFVIGESSGHIDITVTRAGDASGTATVNVATYDQSQAGHASQKSDYEIALAKVIFNPGETSKTVRILLVNDIFAEGDETINLALSNPTGAGVGLGSPNNATVRIIDDDVSAPIIVARSATGSNPAAITAVRDQFRTDIGGGTVAGANGSFGGIRREINWDGVPAAFSAPNNLPSNFFNTTSPRGAVFSTPGTGFQVSGATTDGGAGQPAAQNFGNINATYTATFQQFSPQRLFTALGSNITDVNFFVPGTTTPATVTSFGAIFTDVDTANNTRMQFFDVNGVLITDQAVPAQAGSGSLSFFGVTISNRPIARVRIISGQFSLGPNDNPATDTDLVVMDDFIYSEPVAIVSGPPASNPIDDANFFVRQHYLDFLNREPDTPGFNFWVNEITSCGADATCRSVKRINVSAAFFLSIEFQQTGFLSYLTNRAAFGNFTTGPPVPVLYGEFEKETQQLQKDFIFGQPGADAQLEANKQAYFNDFVNRPEFVVKYPASLTNAQYVDNLLASAGLSPSNFVVNLTNSQENPPTNPTLSGGARRPASYGTAIFSINGAETAMTFTATVNNIDFTGAQTADTNDNLTNAHIHAGALVAPGVNGGVVWGFFGSPFNDNNPNDQVVTPSAGVGGTVSGKWDAPEGNNTTFAAQLANLKEGRAYINFHTVQFGGGEIRGNFPAMTAFRDSLVNGLNGATETRATVLRKVAESPFLNQREFNAAFVLMEYFGYLRRDPDTPGYAFWFDKLNSFNGSFTNAEMVKAFITSGEYRQRFGPG
jgi:uncharacterized protein (TIGR03118 family)